MLPTKSLSNFERSGKTSFLNRLETNPPEHFAIVPTRSNNFDKKTLFVETSISVLYAAVAPARLATTMELMRES